MSWASIRFLIAALGAAAVLGCGKTETAPAKAPSFEASWRRTFSRGESVETEEVLEVRAHRDQFVIAKTWGLIRTTEIVSGGKLVTVHQIQGGARKVSEEDDIEAPYKKFWLRRGQMTRAKDQPASPHGRPATLYELESGGKILAREWVDESKDLMISRENLYPQGTERYELIAFEAKVPEAAVFDPASY